MEFWGLRLVKAPAKVTKTKQDMMPICQVILMLAAARAWLRVYRCKPVCLERLRMVGTITYSEHSYCHTIWTERFFLKHLTKESIVRIYRQGAGWSKDSRIFFLVLLSYALLFEPPYPIYVEVGIVLVECWSETKVAPPSGATCLRNFLEQAPLRPCSLFRDEWS